MEEAMRKTYICRRFRSVGPFEYEADFTDPASPIRVRFLVYGEDGVWQPTPFQVADARHSPREAERLVARYFR
jgi:hypothetical protein